MTVLSRKVMLVYGMPAVSLGAVGVMIALYLPRLYADEIGIPLGQVGAVSAIVQIVDAVTDPLLGVLSDRWHSKWGRRRPLMLVGSVCLAASFVALFCPPLELEQHVALAYAAGTAISVALFLTVARVPWLAWGIELTSVYDEKTTLVSVREFEFVLGALFGAGLPEAVGSFVRGEVGRLSAAAIFWAFVMCITALLCFIGVPDPRSFSPHPDLDTPSQVRPVSPPIHLLSAPICTFLCRIAGNRSAMVLFLAVVLFNMSTSCNALMFPFFVKYILEEEDSMAWILGAYILTGALCIPIWTCLASRFDKKQIFAAGILLFSIVGFVVFFAVRRKTVLLYSSCVVVAGISFGGVAAIKFSLISDVTDVEQVRAGGLRDEGKVIGFFEVSSKAAAGALISCSFWMIDLAGYKPDLVPQNEEAQLAIRVCYALIPALLLLVASATMLFLYPLTRAKHAEVLAELATMAKLDECQNCPNPSGGDAGGGGDGSEGKPLEQIAATTLGKTVH